MRYATVSGPLQTIARYLPANYTAQPTASGDAVLISGEDNAGWTLDDYVIPRLASGLYFAREISAEDAATLAVPEDNGAWLRRMVAAHGHCSQ
jgi:hypothetical protein